MWRFVNYFIDSSVYDRRTGGRRKKRIRQDGNLGCFDRKK